jgi:integrase
MLALLKRRPCKPYQTASPIRGQLRAGAAVARQGLSAANGAWRAQVILGHSVLAVTLEIYNHADEQAQREALTRLHDLFDRTSD